MVESTQEQTIKLTQLDLKCKQSFEERSRYQLVFDSTSNCEVFFRYKAHLIEVNKLSLGITLGKITKADAIETLRKALVHCMRCGDRLVLQCGRLAIDFKETFDGGPDNFPVDMIFNFKEWRKEENYKKVVRPDEDHDLMMNKKCYYINKDFDIIVLQENEDDEEAKAELKLKLPHLQDSFDIFNIQ